MRFCSIQTLSLQHGWHFANLKTCEWNLRVHFGSCLLLEALTPLTVGSNKQASPSWQIMHLLLETHILAVGNALSGTIPSSLSTEAPGLRVLQLSNNQISGTIPADFVNLTNLEQASFVSTL